MELRDGIAAPRLSVGLPVFNGSRWIAEALESILEQSFSDFELIVADNASTDDTVAIVERYAARDARIRLVRQPTNVGPYRNHDDVYRWSRGPYFKWMSCSDVCLPGFFAACIAMLESRPDAVAAYPKTRLLLDEDGRFHDYDDGIDLDDPRPAVRFARYLDRVYLNNPFYGIFRRAVLEGTAMNEPLHGSDLNLIAELTLRGPIVELPERLFLRRFTREATGMSMPREHGLERNAAYHIDWSARSRASLHLRRLTIPRRAPIGFTDKMRVYRYLLRDLAVRVPVVARKVARRLQRA